LLDGGLLSNANNEAINEWFSRLDDAQPEDGRFTQAVLDVAGGFPVYKPPGDAFDNRNDPVRSAQHHDAMVAKTYASEMARFRATMAYGKATDGSAEALEESRRKSRYWSEISTWLKTIF
jgi:hypothetical protein